MATDSELSLLVQANTPFEAQVIAGVLHDEGIVAQVEGQLLADEFAVSQRLMNLQGVRIFVRTEDLERAKRALEAAKQAGRAMDEEAEPPGPVPPPSPNYALRWALGLGILAAVFGVLWLDASAEVRAMSAGPLTSFEPIEGGFRSHWLETGALSAEGVDADQSGVPEQVTYYNREGVKLHVAHDENQNGVIELYVTYAPDGRESTHAVDRDENGIPEMITELWPDGLRVVWRDDNQDGNFEVREVLDKDGNPLRVQEHRGREGMVTK